MWTPYAVNKTFFISKQVVVYELNKVPSKLLFFPKLFKKKL